jgi:hypothetical protein
MARFCIARVFGSLVETRAYNAARNIFAGLRDWPKTLANFAFWEARFMGISGCHPTVAAEDPFRPDNRTSYYAARAASRTSVARQFHGIHFDGLAFKSSACRAVP